MLLYLLEKEFKQFFRNSFLPRFALMFPIVAIVVFPLAANFEIKNIGISIVDSDRSEPSRKLAEKALSSGYFTAAGSARSYGEAMAPGLSAVIANHLQTNTPLVLEGDFLLPRLAAQTHFLAERNDGRVRGLFLHEDDAAQATLPPMVEQAIPTPTTGKAKKIPKHAVPSQ